MPSGDNVVARVVDARGGIQTDADGDDQIENDEPDQYRFSTRKVEIFCLQLLGMLGQIFCDPFARGVHARFTFMPASRTNFAVPFGKLQRIYHA